MNCTIKKEPARFLVKRRNQFICKVVSHRLAARYAKTYDLIGYAKVGIIENAVVVFKNNRA